MVGDGAAGLLLHVAVMLHDPAAEGRERGAAAALAAHLLLHQRLAEALIEVVDQQPGPPVGHAHSAPGGCDGAVLVDQLEQADLAGADRPLAVEIDTQGESGHGRAQPPVTLIWRATAGPVCRRSMMKSWPLGLRRMASWMAASSSSSLSLARRGARRSAASSCPRHI